MTKAILLLSAAVFLLPIPAHGERIQQQSLAPQEIPIIPITHEVTMFVGQITSFRSSERFKTIVLKGDVVNIEAQSDKDVVITAKAAGSEQILMIGEQGEPVANLLVNVTGLERHSVHVHSKLEICTPIGPTTVRPIGAAIASRINWKARIVYCRRPWW